MIDLSTEYLGLKLKNPIVAASSGITATLEGLSPWRSMEQEPL